MLLMPPTPESCMSLFHGRLNIERQMFLQFSVLGHMTLFKCHPYESQVQLRSSFISKHNITFDIFEHFDLTVSTKLLHAAQSIGRLKRD